MGCCPCISALLWVGLPVLAYFLYKYFKGRMLEKKLVRWSDTPKDLVIVHGFEASKTIPCASPFVFKVQTYLRMAGIRYETDVKDSFGPKGKTPWISLNGTHVSDSEFIIEFLNKKFEKNLNKNIDDKKIAVLSSLRILLDEHFVWGLALDRMVFNTEGFAKLTKFPFLFKCYLKYLVTKRSKAQGIGVHSEEEIVKIMSKDLRIVSTILGKDKFFGGEEPCELDAGIFSELAQCLWGAPGSPYERLFNGELQNLKDYCIRMKEKYWPDWDQVISR